MKAAVFVRQVQAVGLATNPLSDLKRSNPPGLSFGVF